MLQLLPLVLVPALAGALAYWLTGRRAIGIAAGAVVFGAMLFIGVTN